MKKIILLITVVLFITGCRSTTARIITIKPYNGQIIVKKQQIIKHSSANQKIQKGNNNEEWR